SQEEAPSCPSSPCPISFLFSLFCLSSLLQTRGLQLSRNGQERPLGAEWSYSIAYTHGMVERWLLPYRKGTRTWAVSL
ncbi:hypothetical protein V8C86DRAFT_2565887, partial [Haematococcus lacustris]